MEKKKAWVWFKGGLDGGSWSQGFTAFESEEGGFVIERADFVSCRVPEWRVKFEEPKDKLQAPDIPKDIKWKYY